MPPLAAGRIRHTVAFTLMHPEGSDAEADFLAAAGDLSAIPGVEAFEILRETSPKNEMCASRYSRRLKLPYPPSQSSR